MENISLCKSIMNLDQWFWKRCHSKIFFIYSSGGPFAQWSKTVCANLVESIMRNISVKLSGLFVQWSRTIRGHHDAHVEYFSEIILSRRRCCLKKKFTDDGCTLDDGGRPVTIAHLVPLAQVS